MQQEKSVEILLWDLPKQEFDEFAESMISFGDICILSYISILGVIGTA